MTAINIRSVSYSYPARRRSPARTALTRVNIAIEPGSTVALLGPNGSGKSTLLKVAAGLLAPDTGQVDLVGRPAGLPADPALGVVFQFIALDGHLTVQENLRDQAVLHGLAGGTARQRIERELHRAGLLDRRHELVKTLSRGLARRADLARARLHDPTVLLLDEPTAGLDPSARRSFLDDLFDRNAATTVVISTHLVDEADRCDRVVMLHEGRVIADGSPTTLRRQYGAEPVVMIRTTADDPPNIAGLGWSRSIIGFFTASTDDPELVSAAAQRLTGSGTEFSITQSTALTLAEVFENLTGARLDVRQSDPPDTPDTPDTPETPDTPHAPESAR